MQRRIAAILALLFVGGIVAVVVGVAGTIVSLKSGSTNAPDTSVPPGWNKHASSEGLTLTIDQPIGPVYSGVQVRGRVSPELAKLNDKVTIQFWTEGAFRALPQDEESKYKGYVDAGTVTAYVGPDGSFEADIMKVPPAIRVNGELRLTEPGQHWYVLILDDKHATFAPFEVTVPRPVPTVSQAPYFAANSFWFLDSKTGWLSASSCRKQPRPTPDQFGNKPELPPPVCKPAFYGTTDGGHSWQLLYHGPVAAFRFASPSLGVALNNGGSCPKGPCRGQILRTTDGGRTWKQTYQPILSLGNLTIVGGEPWLVGNDCDRSTPRASCTSYLLRSSDGGAMWTQTTLPVSGGGYLLMSRPTQQDAWLVANDLMVTHDGGATWESLPGSPVGFEGREEEVFFLTTQQGWLLVGGQPGAGNQAKELFRTSDGGTTWVHASGSLQHPGIYVPGELSSGGYVGRMVFTSSNEGSIDMGRYGILHTVDGGHTWGLAFGPDDPPPLGLQFVDGQHGFALDYYPAIRGQQPSLITTSDGGATWQKLPLPAPENP